MAADYYAGIVIGVDPGLHACGIGIFRKGVLHHADLVKGLEEGRGPPAHAFMANAVRNAVIGRVNYLEMRRAYMFVEFPRIYPHAPIDNNDLLDVAGVASAIYATSPVPKAGWTLPFDWKGNIKKKMMTARILSNLTDAERAVIVNEDHNTIDGVGLGLFVLGRLNKKAHQ